MAHDVFISYASEDKTVADAVCAMIESQGVRCWIAPRDVLPGVAYGEAIIDAIHGSRIMVLIFSSKANASPHIPKEIERAASRGVAVLPFRIEAVSPGKSLDYFIGSVHWLDAFTPPLDGHVKRLAENVKTLLSRGAPPVEPTPPISAPAPPVAPVSVQSIPPPAPSQAARPTGLYLALGVMVLLVLGLCFWFLLRPRMHSPSTPIATTSPSSTTPSTTTSNPSGPSESQPDRTSSGENKDASPPKPPAANGANLYNQGISSYKTQDFSKAATLWQQACDAGEPKGCFGVGVMYEDGKGVAKNIKRSFDLYKRACDQKYAMGCYNLGLMYGNGRGVPKDLKRAADLYQRACDGGNAAACNNLGIAYANGNGVPKDDQKAAELYKRSCNAGDAAGCKNLANMIGQP